jgi:F-type H+-transporting ATPase subunit delta
MTDQSESTTIAAGFLKYLDSIGKRSSLREIIGILQRELEPQLPELVVESASALSDADRAEIIKTLADKPRKGEVQFKVNPELIGGMKVFHGDRVLDMSIQGKLKKIYA